MRTNSALRVGILALTVALATVATATAETYLAMIVTEDGTPLPREPQIIPSMTTRLEPECVILNVFGNGTVNYVVNMRDRNYDPNTNDICSVTIRLKGYRTVQASLRKQGTVVLKRIGLHEGSTVSETALKAPEPAKKAYGKGVEAMTDEKWSAAQKNFEKAVQIDPDYAAAWSDLGQVLKEQSKADEARAAWEKAVQADPKYIKPYIQLSMLDLEEKHPEDAVTIAGRAVAMNPLEFPELYYYYAAANFNLKHYDLAETNVRRAIDLDKDHEVPRAEYLLGTVLIAKRDRAGALQHLNKYLEIVPKAPDADQVKRTIAALEAAPADGK
jgi:tetratricopeptide (TPR) repeat protein